ncbi:hypothetical protein [Neobacillus sp. 19]|uniref:hypothetical protein n=1 Tax=Neobacillus sp. 19 TaxID=3394458 RepID=UPI003BF66E4A
MVIKKTYVTNSILFVFFSTFGMMNTDLKLFDLLFVIVAGLFIIEKNKSWML